MSVTEETSKKEESSLSLDDVGFKIEIATQTLDRNIGFITNCDNKASIMLTAIGVLLTIILTSDGLNKILNIINSCIKLQGAFDLIYLVCFLGTISVMLLGIYSLIDVLVARTSEESTEDIDTASRIFFTGIRKGESHKTYHDRFCNMSKEALLEDLTKEIYINANIASVKYKKYNLGMKRTIIGFALFIMILLIGIYFY